VTTVLIERHICDDGDGDDTECEEETYLFCGYVGMEK
jgi:hypothetical protein